MSWGAYLVRRASEPPTPPSLFSGLGGGGVLPTVINPR